MDFDASTAEPVSATVAEPRFDPSTAEEVSAPKSREIPSGKTGAGMTAEDAAFLKDIQRSGFRTEGSFEEKRLAPAAEQALSGVELPNAPEIPAAADPTGGGRLGAALYQGGVKPLASALTAPLNLVLAPIGVAETAGSTIAKAVSKAAQAYFAGDLAKAGGEKAAKVVEVAQDPNATNQDFMTAVVDAAGTLGFSGLIASHLVGGTKPGEKVAEKPAEPFDPKSAEPLVSEEPFVKETAKAFDVTSAAPVVADKAPEVQYTVFPSEVHPVNGGKIPGYVQIDTKTNEGRGEPITDEQRAQYPSEAEVLATDLPKGQYTLEQVQEAIKAKAEAPPYNDFGSPESDTHGVANRVNEARAKSGDIAPVETGTSPGPEALIAKGREMLQDGETPDQAFARAQTIPDAGDRLGFVRAYGEQLFKKASEAADKFGTDSPEYAAAAKLDSDWASRIQPLKTDLARGFHALQGETEIDTGTFHGIRRAFNELSGREFTPKEEVTAKKFVKDQQAAAKSVEEIAPEFKKAIESVVAPARKTASGKILSNLRERADAAIARQKAKQGRVSAGLDPTDFKDYVEIAAYHLARGIDAGAELLKQFGEKIREHIPGILDAAKKTYADATKGELGNTVAGVYQRAKDYLDKGETNPSDVVAKIAADLGTTQADVWQKLATNKTVRNVTDETFKRMAERRALTDAARNWVKDRSAPLAYRVATAPFRAGFRIATFGHGTVAPFTHAPTLGFNPATFSVFWRNWAKGFKLMGLRDAGAYHERVMQDLVRDPNYITARRAGLANEPHRAVTDYEKAWMGGWLEKIGAVGNRGFDSLKLIRQEYFNQLWDKTPDSQRTPLMAQLFAESVNHATGTVKTSYGPVTRAVFFAPKLIASQFAHLVGDSAKAAQTVAKGAKASPEERAAAISHVKFLATAVGAYASALALNQGLLSASGSKQKINFTDPHQADWLKFKAIGLNIAPVSGPLAMVRLLANLLRIEFGQLEGKEKGGGKGGAMKDAALDFGRSKLSPTASVLTDVVTGTDFQGRPLPFSKQKVPGYLRREGIGPYTYGEYAAEHGPIPVSEAAREIWKKQGMDESRAEHIIKALLMGVEAGAVGARVTPDYKVEGKK